jgi:hypothetical protein
MAWLLPGLLLAYFAAAPFQGVGFLQAWESEGDDRLHPSSLNYIASRTEMSRRALLFCG